MTTSVPSATPVRAPRFVFLDLLRGWALLVMVEVHVFNAFLRPAIRAEAWFTVLNYINGLVAPSFIFISGFAFMIAAERKMDSFRALGKDFWRQVGRIGLIWVVGYYLHLPFFSFKRTVHETTAEGWLKFFQADVLHCIALGLSILFLLRLVVRDNSTYKRILVVLGTVFVFGSLFVWRIDLLDVFPAFIAAYGNSLHYSLFPVFPWLGFMMAGGYLSIRFLEVRAAGTEDAYFRKILRVGLIFAVVCFLVRQLPLVVPFVAQDIRANPLFFIERLGVIMVLLWMCRVCALKRNTERTFVIDVGRESLLVYAAHLMVIYGQFWNDRSLAFYLGGKYGVPAALVGTFGLTVAMIGLAKGWTWLKRGHQPMARGTFALFAVGTTVLFLMR